MNYRHLIKEEINRLLSQNCFSDNWDGITVAEDFTPGNIINTRFSGIIKLGNCSGTTELSKNVSKTCGIYNSSVCDCEIADQVYIADVRNLSNYIIDENVAISNVGSITVTGESSFGNGTEIELLNEGGGRELLMFDGLSAQIAYLTVIYRHDVDFTGKMLDIIKAYCRSKQSDRGVIKSGTRISNSNVIHNVSFGSYATVSGAVMLEEGTLMSTVEAPSHIGEGVMAKNFIIQSGSVVDGGAILDKSFVGQGVRIGKQYSSENSVFFANSEAFHGESCSLFAGPYTVTHHKSTLLIATLVSFFNAGSGTNQSNHMYKLGPVHQGILERGSKTGSFAYLLLPAHIGAFTVVVGKHYNNFDTSEFPFSYISEEKGKSILTPAMNLFTVGTRRDNEKWPARDRRKDRDKRDLIHFPMFNPYIAGKITSAIRILDDLIEKTDRSKDFVSYKGISIPRLLLKTARKYYDMAIKIYMGQQLAARMKRLADDLSLTDLRSMLAARGTEGNGKWVDICGLLSPAGKIEELIDGIKTSKLRFVEELNGHLFSIYEKFECYAWEWCSDLISKYYCNRPEDLPVTSLLQIITDWRTNAVRLNNMILQDAMKEFDAGSMISYGADGDSGTRNSDFHAVRGEFDKNKFVTGLKKESEEIEREADRLTALFGRIV